MTAPGKTPEPVWSIAANVVLWRRHGEGGQALRPGTRRFKGGAKVYVCSWTGERTRCTVAGRPRGTSRYAEAYVATRDLHGFRPRLVHGPALVPLVSASPFEDRAHAAAVAAELERYAREYRSGAWPSRPHPEPCLCHECLNPDR
ncbi:hypothetical protein OG625_09295 [Streptomyces sp. NBC_01351]|uniref:hypothetical protein n=1 Tax=Streptomyces sp. NBC_01351 TaxID=2903833 RepID=UPI002E37BDD6|nr:hypothetical protein [Streptomyces sp. NBC_01351]